MIWTKITCNLLLVMTVTCGVVAVNLQVAFLKKELLQAMQAIDELFQANQVHARICTPHQSACAFLS